MRGLPLLFTTALACTPVQGEQTYVLLDLAAVEAGAVVHGDNGTTDSVLPDAVAVADTPELEHLGSRTPLLPDPGLLLFVQGPNARVQELWLDIDIASDQVVVAGSEAAAEQLGDWTGATVDRHDRGTLLTLDGIYDALGALPAEANDLDIESVLPVSEFDLPGTVLATAPDRGRSTGRLVDLFAPIPPRGHRADAPAERAAAARVDATWDVAELTMADVTKRPGGLWQDHAATAHPPRWVGRYCSADRELLLRADGSATLADAHVTLEAQWQATGGQLSLQLPGGALLLDSTPTHFDHQGSEYRDRLHGGC